MRYAVFSDLHANLQAWEQALKDMQEHAVDELICLGDAVGYGPRPEEVLASIRIHTPHFVMGNHDAAAAGLFDASAFNDHARRMIEWTRDQLSPGSIEFLLQIPLTLELEHMLFVHAEIEEPGRFEYIESEADAAAHLAHTKQAVTFIGHTHNPLLFVQHPDGSLQRFADEDVQLDPGIRAIVNVGSVGDMRHETDDRARYVIYDSSTREVFFRRVEWDREAFHRDMAATVLTVDPSFNQQGDARKQYEVSPIKTLNLTEALARNKVSLPIPKHQLEDDSMVGATTHPPNVKAKPNSSRRSLIPMGITALLVVLVAVWLLWPESPAKLNPVAPPKPAPVSSTPKALPPLALTNASFETPAVRNSVQKTPTGWALTEGGRQNLVQKKGRPGFNKFKGHQKQLVSMKEGGGIFQNIGKAGVQPGRAVSVRLLQFHSTSVNKGGGLSVELWDGHPNKTGKKLVEQRFSPTKKGTGAERTATLRIPNDAQAGAALFLVLRHDPKGGRPSNVSIDHVRLATP